MKTNRIFGLAAIACGFAMSFTSCGEQDNAIIESPTTPTQTYVISFEGQALNADGYWCGDETGEKFDNWGSDGYSCSYEEAGVVFPVTYTPAWSSWSGYAISSRTVNYYKTVTPDQFNSIAGGAHSGNNFCVVYPFIGDIIDLGEKGAIVKGFFYTNEAWTVDAILKGDGMSPGVFNTNDWLKCTVIGTKLDDTTASVDLYLAKDGDFVWRWLYADLSSLGKVKSLYFEFDGTKKNDWGLTTPTYLCIDDIEIEK